MAQEVVRRIVTAVNASLTELPPEVAGDIYERGIILTGGGALFTGLDDYLRDQTNLPVRVVNEPRYAIVRGLEQMFDEPFQLRRILTESQVGLDLENASF